jgi:hypothetical protein
MEITHYPDGTPVSIHQLNYKEKEWYKRGCEKSAERGKQRITCECGTEISYGHRAYHNNTQKHKKLMRTLENKQIPH